VVRKVTSKQEPYSCYENEYTNNRANVKSAYIASDVYVTKYDDYHIPSNDRNDDHSTEKTVSR
jgi:hypothetical protein